MADSSKKFAKFNITTGKLEQEAALKSSAGPFDAGRIVATNDSGVIDPSMYSAVPFTSTTRATMGTNAFNGNLMASQPYLTEETRLAIASSASNFEEFLKVHEMVKSFEQLACMLPVPSSTTVTSIGATFTVTGTATSRSTATTNYLTRRTRIGYVSASTAGALCGLRTSVATISHGDAIATGGFILSILFGISDTTLITTDPRTVIGIGSANAPTNVDPSTLAPCLGIAQFSSDPTHWYFVSNSGSTFSSLQINSTSFPVDNTTPYSLKIYSPNYNAAKITVTLTNLATGASTFWQPTVVQPFSTLLAVNCWRCNNSTAAAAAIDLGSLILTRF